VREVAALCSAAPSFQESMIFNAERRAWRLVQEHSAIIEKVAVQLVEYRSMLGRQVWRMFQRSQTPQVWTAAMYP
jgi:ATP-dependent Zn protease